MACVVHSIQHVARANLPQPIGLGLFLRFNQIRRRDFLILCDVRARVVDAVGAVDVLCEQTVLVVGSLIRDVPLGGDVRARSVLIEQTIFIVRRLVRDVSVRCNVRMRA